MLGLPVLRHLVGGLPPIANDIRKPGVDRARLRPHPAARHALRPASCSPTSRRSLPQVTAPLLMLRSAVDHVVPTSSAKLVLARVSSTDVTDVVLHDSYHVATMDEDAPLVFARSVDFVQRVASEVAA